MVITELMLDSNFRWNDEERVWIPAFAGMTHYTCKL